MGTLIQNFIMAASLLSIDVYYIIKDFRKHRLKIIIGSLFIVLTLSDPLIDVIAILASYTNLYQLPYTTGYITNVNKVGRLELYSITVNYNDYKDDYDLSDKINKYKYKVVYTPRTRTVFKLISSD